MQAQLIQSEKMASLGLLTAGIAHEIQNPLNFVNNFSDVTAELIEEWSEEIKNGNGKEAVLLVDNVKENLRIIGKHGKRADAIVKSMLQHSRTSTGVKESAHINAIVEECLQLSYHGMKAKDSSFYTLIDSVFDTTIGNIYVVTQDISRVFLNLFNNAFYAIQQRRKQEGSNYEPRVTVKTKRLPGSIEIYIHDNGGGISAEVVDKIFQPFFTTKPAGEGTGLGLSLCYDIVKAHGGEIRVTSTVGEYCEFIVELPVYVTKV